MIRNIKVLGLALVAVFAFSAIAASAASAQNGRITSTGPVTLDGTEDGINAFTGFGAKVECPNTVVTGHKTLTTKQTEEKLTHELIPSGSSSFTLTLDLPANCNAVEAGTNHRTTVTLNGCDFDIEILTQSGGIWPTRGSLVCPTGKDIEIEVYPFSGSELGGVVCTFTIKPQSGKEGVHLTNGSLEEGGGVKRWDVTAAGAYKGFTATRSGSGCSTAEENASELDFNYTFKGTNNVSERTDVTVS